MTYRESCELLRRCNHTELYQRCRELGLPALASMDKEELIDILIGGPQPGLEIEHPHDPWRRAIMAFLLDHWDNVRAQLGCPAKTGDPLSCFKCTDAQVVYCLVDNADEEFHIRKHLVQLKRKPA